MRSYILIITSSFDETVDYLENKYGSRISFYRLNVDKFDDYQFYVTNDGWKIESSFGSIYNKNIKSIYYRKPYYPDLSEYELKYHGLIKNDITTVVNGLVDSFCGRVLSKPKVLRYGENKINQLLYVSNKNILFPKSYIGNTNKNFNNYFSNKKIIKPISIGRVGDGADVELYQTNLYKDDDNRRDISLTPIYVQEYIEKKYEVRITIVGLNIYAVRIDTSNKIDWRLDYSNHKYTVIKCPKEIEDFCIQMLIDFQLEFGAFDFIVTNDNQWYFLEVNPNGQWLWLEKILALDISEKIIDLLDGKG